MLNIITNNPYRMLGVFANATKKDIVANKGKANAFLKVNKSVEYPLDLKGILPAPNRTLEVMSNAEAHLAIAKEQIKYAQFWFLKMTPIDDVAFNYLFAGNIEQSKELWSKQESLSSLQNRIVLDLIKDNTMSALQTAERLYNKYGSDYINKVDANCTLKMSAAELLFRFIDTLGGEIGMHKLLGNELGKETKEYITSQTVGPLINKISSEVDKTKKVNHKDPNARIDAAEKLFTNTKDFLSQLRSILPDTDPQYQMIADKLGLEILQCGIDYFNNSDDDDAPYKAMEVQKQGLSIVVGSLAKQRCEENVRILQKIIDALPPKAVKTEDKAIKAELSKFVGLPDKISYAINLLNNTRSHLQSIKNKLGPSNTYYLKMSTQIVGNALHNVVEEVNHAQQPLSVMGRFLSNTGSILLNDDNEIADKIIEAQSKFRLTLMDAWEATKLMDTFDMEPNFKSNYNRNRSTLISMCNQLGIPTYRSSSTAPHVGTTTSARTTLGHVPQSDNKSGSGCMVTLLAIMGMAAMCIICLVSIL